MHFSCRWPLSTVLHDSKSAGNVKFSVYIVLTKVTLIKNSVENGLAEFVGMKNFVDYTSRKCFASARVAVPRLKRLGYAIHSHSFCGLVIQINIDSFSLGARHLFQKLVFFFMRGGTCDTLLFSE
jgi:hypothetical protein